MNAMFDEASLLKVPAPRNYTDGFRLAARPRAHLHELEAAKITRMVNPKPGQ
ncbi:hypothetical protein QTI33_22285 [Variovorax sp. J22P271]|nr:hypothetical protein [Variovorax sp. J22P271]